jgi:hypothetical protein
MSGQANVGNQYQWSKGSYWMTYRLQIGNGESAWMHLVAVVLADLLVQLL